MDVKNYPCAFGALLLVLLISETVAESENRKALVGSSVNLPCKVDAPNCGELHSVKWYRDTSRIYVYSQFSSISRAEGRAQKRMTVEYTQNSTEALLKIDNVELEDEASYKCEITYLEVRENCDVVQIIKLQTLVKPEPARIFPTSQDPSLQKTITNTTYGPYDEGTEIELVCEANGGKPEPVVTWYNGTQRMNFPSKGVEVEGLFRSSSTLHTRLSRGDLGARYTCQVTSDALEEPMVSWVTMDVHVKPRTMNLQYQEQVIQGSTVLLICDVYGANPAANVIWYNNSNVITNESLIRITPEAMRDDGTYTTKTELEFKAQRWDDSRNFRCYAENSVTKHQTDTSFYRQFTLQVKYAPVVTVSPENVTITESLSSSILLKCWASANPAILKRVFWLKDGKNITLTSDKYEGGTETHPFLTIKNVSRDDMGEYTCTCMNEVGASESENSAYVNVLFAPAVEVHLDPENAVKALDGVNVTAMCVVAAGNPPELQKVRWFLGDELLKELPECNYTTNESNSTGGLYCNVDPSILSLVTVSQSFAGNYTCQGMNSVGWGYVSESTELIVYYPPSAAKLTYIPKKVVKKGQVDLICSVDHPGRPENLSYIWYRGRHKLSGQTTSKLTINPVKLDTRNNFTCMASNEGGTGESSTVSINVSAPPTFITPLKYPVVIADQSEMSLTCRVECSPLCFISWFKGNEQIDTRNSKLYDIKTTIRDANAKTGDFESIESTLIWNVDSWASHPFAKTTPPANYMCISSSNGMGAGVNASVVVEVQYAPENLILSSNIISIVEGQTPPQVVCNGKGFPDIHYAWVKNTTYEVKEVSQTSILNLPPITRNDTGSYICKASNSRGDADTTMSLIVEYAPECNITKTKYNSKPALLCMVNAIPEEVTFSWRIPPTNDTSTEEHVLTAYHDGIRSYMLLDLNVDTFRTYQCNASNSAGFGKPCEIDVAGMAAASDSWWPAFSDNTLIIIAIIAGIILCAIFVCIVIIIIICVCRRRRARNKLPNQSSTADRIRPGGFSKDGSTDPLTNPADRGFYENLPFHGMQTPPNKPISIIAPFVQGNRSAPPKPSQPQFPPIAKTCTPVQRHQSFHGFSNVTRTVPQLPIMNTLHAPNRVKMNHKPCKRLSEMCEVNDEKRFSSLEIKKTHRCYSPLFYSVRCKKHGKKRPVVYAIPKNIKSDESINNIFVFKGEEDNTCTVPNQLQKIEVSNEDQPKPAPRCKRHKRNSSCHVYENISFVKSKSVIERSDNVTVDLDSSNNSSDNGVNCEISVTEAVVHCVNPTTPPRIQSVTVKVTPSVASVSPVRVAPHTIKQPSDSPRGALQTQLQAKLHTPRAASERIHKFPVPQMPLLDQNKWTKLTNANQTAFYTLTAPHYKHTPNSQLTQHHQYAATIPHQKPHMKLIPRGIFQDQQLSKSKSFSSRTKQKKHFQIPLQKCNSFKFQTAESYFQPIKNVHEENFMRNGYVSDISLVGYNDQEYTRSHHKKERYKNKGPLVLRKPEHAQELQYPQPVYNRNAPNGLVYADLDMPNDSSAKENSICNTDSPRSKQQKTKPKTEYATLNFNEVGKEIDV